MQVTIVPTPLKHPPFAPFPLPRRSPFVLVSSSYFIHFPPPPSFRYLCMLWHTVDLLDRTDSSPDEENVCMCLRVWLCRYVLTKYARMGV